jgi:RHS repeat-associated protein
VGSGASAYGFTGEQQSGGLVYLRARYYASGVGRFLTRDVWNGDMNRPMSYNVWLYVENNPTNMVDPRGLKGVLPWGSYQRIVRNTANIANEPIGKKEISVIISNFEGNPYIGTYPEEWKPNLTRPADVRLFDTCDETVQKFLRNRTPEDQRLTRGFPSYDLNRLDWLFSGWVDYWAWRAGKAGRQAVLTDPNILKANALTESSIGNILTVSDPKLVDRFVDGKDDPTKPNSLRSLMNLTSGSGFYEALSNPTDYDKRRKGYDLSWGTMDITVIDRFNPIIEVGAVVRVLHAKFNATRWLPKNGNASAMEIWRQVLQTYGPGSTAPDYDPCYGDKLLTIATIGKWYRGCTGEFVNASLSGPFIVNFNQQER